MLEPRIGTTKRRSMRSICIGRYNMKTHLFLLFSIVALFNIIAVTKAAEPGSLPGDTLLVEAESFADYGGWSLDTQFIPIMATAN